MKNRAFIFISIGIIVVAFALTYGALSAMQAMHAGINSQTVAVQEVGNDIFATGSIHSENEAILHFPAGGKLVYLPVKEGDKVYTGETIAQLDTYAIQQALTQALNNYKSTRDTFDQTQANAQTGVLQSGQKSNLSLYSQSTIGGGDAENNAINDAVKRIVDQNQANLDNSVINVQLANYALQMSSLTAPFNGVVTNEDVTTAGQNITPATSFSVADPTQEVFRANVDASDIDFVSVGSTATIKINNLSIPASVEKIYPQKMTLPTGEEVYQVDVSANNLSQDIAKLGQTGSVLIQSIARGDSVTVPSWTIVGHNYIWVLENNKPTLKKVTVGNVHGDRVEVSGLLPTDKVITDPSTLAAQTYKLL